MIRSVFDKPFRSIVFGVILLIILLVISAPGRTQPYQAVKQTGTSTASFIKATVKPTRSIVKPGAGLAAFKPTLTATDFKPILPTRTPRPTLPTRVIPTAPAQAKVKDIYGYGQLLALSCEARSAADWARHFGVTIHELDFFQKLPKSKNPEEGFVGDPNGGWGNIPPGPYGVHAAPVAKLLTKYGVPAKAERNISFNQVQAEIAAGRPVIVWVTGHVEPGKGQAYEVEAGKTVTVARYEHTVIVTGYDAKQVSILDGKTVYQRPIETFLKSWSALENMAVFWDGQATAPVGCDPITCN